MPRLRLRPDSRARLERGDVTLELMIGPTTFERDPSVEELAVAWEIQRDEIMRGDNAPPGTRPWAWWRFDLGEDRPPDAEAVRLADLGELTDEERAALREAATEARLRVGTPAERWSGGNSETGVSLDARAVQLFEAVQAA